MRKINHRFIHLRINSFKKWAKRHLYTFINIVWWASFFQILTELVTGIYITDTHGGMSWSVFTSDSGVELASTVVVLIFTRYEKYHFANKHLINDADAVFEKKKVFANRIIAILFFSLAIISFVFSGLFGQRAHDTNFTTAAAWGFFISSLLLGYVKWILIQGHNGPRSHDAKQTIVCSITGIPVLITAHFQIYSESVDLVCAMVISVIMIFLGVQSWRETDLHVH